MLRSLLLALLIAPSFALAHPTKGQETTRDDIIQHVWGANDNAQASAPQADLSRAKSVMRSDGIVVTDLDRQLTTTPVAFRSTDGSIEIECLEGVAPVDTDADEGRSPASMAYDE
jgi:hypothetical protein